MSYTPPGQPQQPVSPDGRWWWDGSQWRPNASNPFGETGPALDNSRDPASVSEGTRFVPGPPGVPNPYVPPRLSDDAVAAPAEVPFQLPPSRRGWWTLPRLVTVLVGAVLMVVLVVGLLFWLSVEAFQTQRGAVSDVEVRTAMVTTAQEMTAYRVDFGQYPSDLTQLTGHTPDPKVDLTLLPIEDPATSFCLAAGPHGEEPTMWYSGSSGPMEIPCG